MLLSKTAVSFEMIMVGRFLYGINSGEPAVREHPLNLFLPFTCCFSATLTSPFNPTWDQFLDVFTSYISRLIRPFVSQLLILIGSSQNVWFPRAPSGISLTAHSIYLVECAPKRLRGMVGVTVATFISFGKFCGQLLGIRWAVMDAAGSQVGVVTPDVCDCCLWSHGAKGNVALAASSSAQRNVGTGCSGSMASPRCCSSPPCPSCRSPPGFCCWIEETARPVRKVWRSNNWVPLYVSLQH